MLSYDKSCLTFDSHFNMYAHKIRDSGNKIQFNYLQDVFSVKIKIQFWTFVIQWIQYNYKKKKNRFYYEW